MDSKFYLAHNINPETLKGGNTYTTVNNVFIANSKPKIPYTEDPLPFNQFFYVSFAEGSVSVIGRNPEPGYFTQLSFVIPCSTEDGTHQISASGTGISSVLFCPAGMFKINKGEIKFQRNKVQKTIEATFNLYIIHKHEEEDTKEYHINGNLLLTATGPLCAEN